MSFLFLKLALFCFKKNSKQIFFLVSSCSHQIMVHINCSDMQEQANQLNSFQDIMPAVLPLYDQSLLLCGSLKKKCITCIEN